MSTSRLQAAFARKREAEMMRIEKNSEINRYFDHWGKVTSRFEAWTTPEYYKHAEENMRKDREKKVKKQQLEERRQRLRELLNKENLQHREELKALRVPKSRKMSTEFLQKMDKIHKEQEEDRKRLELEAKLYGKLRYGINDEASLFESAKNDHQVLAKLNWLDKQIENQLQREQQEKEADERKLRFEEEARKREEYLKERQIIQESEIKELKNLQETHLTALKERETEYELLQKEEQQFKRVLEEIEIEMISFSNRKQQRKTDFVIPHNIKRIKMILRQCSEKFRKDLKDDIDLLKRIFSFCCDDHIHHLIEKYETYYDFEIQRQSQIEAMYESEAKQNLLKWNETWSQDDSIRERQISTLLEKQKNYLKDKLSNNLKQQGNLVGIRETHLKAIENANQKLEMLTKEQDSYDKQGIEDKCDSETTNGTTCKLKNRIPSSSSSSSSVFKHGRDMRNEEESLGERLSASSISSRGSSATTGPRFGRKKVAWI